MTDRKRTKGQTIYKTLHIKK